MTIDDQRPRTRPSTRFILLSGTFVVLAFLAGFGWQFVEARSARAERNALEQELAFQELATTLAAAVIQAEYGSYDGARDLMSTFFTRLQEELAAAPDAARPELEAMLERRDAVITALSRSQQTSRTTLARLFVQYQSAFGRMEQGLPLPTPASPRPAAADTMGGG